MANDQAQPNHHSDQVPDIDWPKVGRFTVERGEGFHLDDCPTSLGVDEQAEPAYRKHLAKLVEKNDKLLEKLHAAGLEGVVFMVQAMDAAGKDSMVEHVFTGMNPAFIQAHSFKSPSKEELAHDYLWRVNAALPERGMIGIFNRSHYEDLVCVRVCGFWKGYSWPARCCDMSEEEFIKMRCRQVRDYERYLYENGYRMVKIFLNVSKDEQARRFLSRIDEQRKNWKFSVGDMGTRDQWDAYQNAYEDAIKGTATEENPWYVIPADQKFVAQLLAADALHEVLKDIDPQYPSLSAADLAEMDACRETLVAQLNG